MRANPNFLFLKKHIKTARHIALQGGTRSGKTYSVIYFFIWLCSNYSGLEIDIIRATLPALKSTAWKDFVKVMMEHGVYDPKNHNKTEGIYNLNGNVINYYSTDQYQKVQGKSRDILWVNEAVEISEDIIDQLTPRTRHKIIYDFNPDFSDDHWLARLIDKRQIPHLVTTYNDNPHLTEEQIHDIESKKGKPYWWSVFGQGQRAKREGLVFHNWEVGAFDDSLPYGFGQDYGDFPDPTTLVKVAIDEKRKRLYLHECYYQTKLSTSQIFDLNFEWAQKKRLIVADHDKTTIRELRGRGLNIREAIKGPGSVNAGIKKLHDYQIIVTPESINLQKELRNYHWLDNRHSVPVDDFNHLIDPARYYVTFATRGSGTKFR